MSVYDLLEYSRKYSMISESLWNSYRDEVNDSANEIDENDNKTNNSKKQQVNFLSIRGK